MTPHLLVTNDFPPKVGGIQSYLWELWRRLPPGSATVFTTPYPGAAAWDASQPFPVVRSRQRVLLPTTALAHQIDDVAEGIGADLVLLDPALPLGLLGPRLRHRYGIILHGAEVTVPGRLPLTRRALARVLRGASLVIAAGGYPLAEGERAAGAELPSVVIPPGVDVERFRPLTLAERAATRRRLGVSVDGPLVVGTSRLVPRKGFDVLLQASALLRDRHPDLTVVITGGGRDRRRLERVAARAGAPVRFLGRVDDDLVPAIAGCGDVFAMLCRNRWFGLEQEGFGIVFLEAASAGVPQVAGASGGAAEAVEDGVTGFVVEQPNDPRAVAERIGLLLHDPVRREAMGRAARARTEASFAYEVLAKRLAEAVGANMAR